VLFFVPYPNTGSNNTDTNLILTTTTIHERKISWSRSVTGDGKYNLRTDTDLPPLIMLHLLHIWFMLLFRLDNYIPRVHRTLNRVLCCLIQCAMCTLYAMHLLIYSCIPKPTASVFLVNLFLLTLHYIQIYNAPYISIRKRIWSAANAPKRLHIAGFKHFSFKTVFKCQKCISWTGVDIKRVPDCRSGYIKCPRC